MASYTDDSYRTFLAATALEKGRIVKLTGNNTVGYAGTSDDPIAVTADKAFAAGDPVRCKLIASQGTFEIATSGSATGLTAGAAVGSMDANGQAGVSGNGATKLLWQLVRAATAGQLAECALK